MPAVVLDCNVWDQLNLDPAGRARAAVLVREGQLRVIVPASLKRELDDSPFKGVPTWFETEQAFDSVFALDHSGLGEARLGEGQVYEKHLGTSKKVPDAVIVDAADTEADIFVSQDVRSRNRYAAIRGAERSMEYQRFRREVLGLLDEST